MITKTHPGHPHNPGSPLPLLPPERWRVLFGVNTILFRPEYNAMRARFFFAPGYEFLPFSRFRASLSLSLTEPFMAKWGMKRNVLNPVRSSVAVSLMAALLLGGCGDGDQAQTKKAAGALSDYYYRSWKRPSPDWDIRKVRAGKDDTVTIETRIVTKTLTKAIMERSKAEQMEIARLACPAYTDGIWAEINKAQHVGIVLSGSAGHIINALCKRP